MRVGQLSSLGFISPTFTFKGCGLASFSYLLFPQIPQQNKSLVASYRKPSPTQNPNSSHLSSKLQTKKGGGKRALPSLSLSLSLSSHQTLSNPFLSKLSIEPFLPFIYAFAMLFNSPAPNMRTNGDDDSSAEIVKRQRTTTAPSAISGDAGDGSSIEISKRPRGRPPGSKNKPKPPIIITRESEPSAAMRPHILEIPAGADIVDSLIRFSSRKSLGICVLSGSGTVTNVTLRQPPHPTATVEGAPTTVGFRGRYEILSLSATVMPPAASAVFAPAASVTVAAPHGQVIGGTVVGPLVAAGTVTLMAATFDNPTFHRLPAVDDEVAVARSGSVSGGGEDSGGAQQQEAEEDQQQQHYVHREYQHQAAAAAESCGMAIYSSHFPAEVIWAPNARPQNLPPY